MKRICFFRHSLLNRGGDKMILAHAGYLAARGEDVVIRCSVSQTIFEIPDGVEIDERGGGKLKTLLRALCMKQDADIVVADIIPLALLLSLRNRGRLLYFAQDYDEYYYLHLWQRLFIRLLYFLGLTLLRVRTISVADHLTTLLRRRFRGNVETVNNGVDTRIFYPDPDPELKAKKENRMAVVLLSRNDPRKGFDLGRQIIARLKTNMPRKEVEVWTVGEPFREGFPGFKHRDFGYVSAECLRKILSTADAFLYHTRHEGFPLMALEALACGCPMVASKAVSVVRPGVEALISDVGDVVSATEQLAQVLRDKTLAARLRTNGIKFSREHSLNQSTKLFADILFPEIPNTKR